MEQENTLLKNLENMKLDIYYLYSTIKRVELELKENNEDIRQIKTKNKELHTEVSQNNGIHNTQINKKVNELEDEISKLHSRINELESNQENVSELVDDLDSKISKLSNFNSNDSKSNEIIINSINEALHQKIKAIEEHFELQISKIYDTMYNEILDLKVEIKKNKKKSNVKKD